ncbi:MAG: hypothetical protein M0R76_11495 [Proteobacteria bacterium]|nr:hypothetical protein [Pseudomonadota bacterium]
MKNLAPLCLAIAVVLSAVACQKQMIPNTEVPDNRFNRSVIEFCERYRHAVEDLNIGLLMSMASPRYFDNAGTPSGDDDYDRDGLEEILHKRFTAIKAMRYEFKYRDIYERNGLIGVEVTYTMSFQYEVDGKSRWHNRTADKRLELEVDDEAFLFVSGM